MPGPVSDSYDPEFSSGTNAQAVRDAIVKVRSRVSRLIGSDDLKYIVEVAEWVLNHDAVSDDTTLWEAELRVIRFALDRVEDTI